MTIQELLNKKRNHAARQIIAAELLGIFSDKENIKTLVNKANTKFPQFSKQELINATSAVFNVIADID